MFANVNLVSGQIQNFPIPIRIFRILFEFFDLFDSEFFESY